MKRYLIVLLLLIPGLCFGAEAVKTVSGVADSSIKTVTGVASASIKTMCGVGYNDGDTVSCSASTDYVGDKTAYATASGDATNVIVCGRYAPTCASGCTSGTFGTAYIRHMSTDSDNTTMCVYDSSDTSPQSGDAIVGTESGTISSSTNAEWVSAVVDSGTATCSNYYWVCFNSGGKTWNYAYASGSSYYKANAGACPATMGTGWSSVARKISMYYTVGP